MEEIALNCTKWREKIDVANPHLVGTLGFDDDDDDLRYLLSLFVEGQKFGELNENNIERGKANKNDSVLN